jgi:endonuclease III
VDTHVHRISQRFGWVPSTVKSPEDTRKCLESWLPRKHWGTINHLLVGLGQTVCVPVHPKCAMCELNDICPNAFKETKVGSGSKSKREAKAPPLESDTPAEVAADERPRRRRKTEPPREGEVDVNPFAQYELKGRKEKVR